VVTTWVSVGTELSSGPLRSLAAGRGIRKDQMSEEEERLVKDNHSLALQVIPVNFALT